MTFFARIFFARSQFARDFFARTLFASFLFARTLFASNFFCLNLFASGIFCQDFFAFFPSNFLVFSCPFYCLASLTAAESSGRQAVMKIHHTKLSKGQDQVLPEAG